MADLEPREELASIAASLRAYLEWQVDCGSAGIPRKKRDKEAEPASPPPPPRAASVVPDSTTASANASTNTPPSLPPISLDSVPPSLPPSVLPPSVLPPSVGTRPVRELHVIESEVKGCTKCGLAPSRTNTVFSRGNPEAKLCFVGEAPGADEDEQGLPFVGRAGQLLDRMIVAMGLDPAEDVYVCNIIKCRPPGNRRPEPAEIDACIPYLHEQLAKIEPKAIVAMGNTAVAALLGTKVGITKVRGAWKLYRGRIPVMPTYHPSYLLRPSPTQVDAKREAWEDLQTVMKELGLSKPARS